MDPLLINLLLTGTGVGGAGWLIYTNYPKIEEMLQMKLSSSLHRDGGGDKTSQPLHKIFYLYKHESVGAWSKWMESQNAEIKDIAYTSLVQYLACEADELGSLTPEVIRTIPSFKRPETFQIVAELIDRCRKKVNILKAVDNYLEEAASALLKIDCDRAEKFLIDQYHKLKDQTDTAHVRTGIIRSLIKSQFNNNLLDLVIDFLRDEKNNVMQKSDLLADLEGMAEDSSKIEFFKNIFLRFISQSHEIGENTAKIMQIIFSKLDPVVFCENPDEDIWRALINGLEGHNKSHFIKFLEYPIQNKEKFISSVLLKDLINKDEPVRSSIRDLIIKRFKLTEKELDILKTPVKQEDVDFIKQVVVVEKGKKTKTITHELLGDYHTLEKLIFNSDAHARGNLGSVQTLMGAGVEEKLYLLRGMCGNHNRGFVYIDIDQLIGNTHELGRLKQLVNNNKPCFIYFDNLDKLLTRAYTDYERDNAKELSKILKELALLPSINFLGNIPYNREELKKLKPDLLNTLQSTTAFLPFRISLNIEKPDEKDRRRIFLQAFAKIDAQRASDSNEFNLDVMIAATEGMSMLEYLQFMQNYFEISLFAFGKLISMEEFALYSMSPIQAPSEYQMITAQVVEE
ncbi:MAG: hypothetical protein LW817_06330 [Candidatus Caenarcaniphilales bacterium]|nr:hypothetical protein [Candidatus Caenarcaniphilales bacterium]